MEEAPSTCGQSHRVSSGQPAPVIGHSGAETTVGEWSHHGGQDYTGVQPSDVTVDYPTWEQTHWCVRARL